MLFEYNNVINTITSINCDENQIWLKMNLFFNIFTNHFFKSNEIEEIENPILYKNILYQNISDWNRLIKWYLISYYWICWNLKLMSLHENNKKNKKINTNIVWSELDNKKKNWSETNTNNNILFNLFNLNNDKI